MGGVSVTPVALLFYVVELPGEYSRTRSPDSAMVCMVGPNTSDHGCHSFVVSSTTRGSTTAGGSFGGMVGGTRIIIRVTVGVETSCTSCGRDYAEPPCCCTD